MGSPLSRRHFLLGTGTLAVGLGSGISVQSSPERPRGTRVILLGTGGGPRPMAERAGPSQVIVIDGVPYVVDCGDGVARQLVRARINPGLLSKIFITHQHSDHNVDYGNLTLLAWASGLSTRVDAYGPPPIEKMTELFFDMSSYDIETRGIDECWDESRAPLAPLIHAHELDAGGVVMEDARVKVTAALVNHPPVEPSFAYRFDTADRSIVISGDTRPSDAVVEACSGCDVLVHEVYCAADLKRAPPRGRTYFKTNHTSTRELAGLARRAKPKLVVLYHLLLAACTGDDLLREMKQYGYVGKVVVGADLTAH